MPPSRRGRRGRARAPPRGELGRLAVGFTGSVTYALLPVLANALRDAAARASSSSCAASCSRPTQVKRLTTGARHRLPAPADRDARSGRAVRSEPLVVALPHGHPLARLDEVPVARLASEPFVTYPSHFRSSCTTPCARLRRPRLRADRRDGGGGDRDADLLRRRRHRRLAGPGLGEADVGRGRRSTARWPASRADRAGARLPARRREPGARPRARDRAHDAR